MSTALKSHEDHEVGAAPLPSAADRYGVAVEEEAKAAGDEKPPAGGAAAGATITAAAILRLVPKTTVKGPT